MQAQHLPLFLEDEPLLKYTTPVNLFLFCFKGQIQILTSTVVFLAEGRPCFFPERPPFPEVEEMDFSSSESLPGVD